MALSQQKIGSFWKNIDRMAQQSEVPQIELVRIIARFVKICKHRWRALPTDTPEKKLLADAGKILSIFKAE